MLHKTLAFLFLVTISCCFHRKCTVGVRHNVWPDGHALRLEALLRHAGHAQERRQAARRREALPKAAAPLALHAEPDVGRRRLGAGLGEAAPGEGVERRVDAVELSNHELDELHAAVLAEAEAASQRHSREAEACTQKVAALAAASIIQQAAERVPVKKR